MQFFLSQKEFEEKIEEMTMKYLDKKPNKKGELEVIFVELFTAETEEGMLAKFMDFDQKYEFKNYLIKVGGMYKHMCYPMPKNSKINTIKWSMINSILLLKNKYKTKSLKEMNENHSTEFQDFFGMYYQDKFEEINTHELLDESDEKWCLKKLKGINVDEFTINRIKKKQEIEEEVKEIGKESKYHSFIKVENEFYDIETLDGVKNPIELKRVKEKILGEKVYE